MHQGYIQRALASWGSDWSMSADLDRVLCYHHDDRRMDACLKVNIGSPGALGWTSTGARQCQDSVRSEEVGLTSAVLIESQMVIICSMADVS